MFTSGRKAWPTGARLHNRAGVPWPRATTSPLVIQNGQDLCQGRQRRQLLKKGRDCEFRQKREPNRSKDYRVAFSDLRGFGDAQGGLLARDASRTARTLTLEQRSPLRQDIGSVAGLLGSLSQGAAPVPHRVHLRRTSEGGIAQPKREGPLMSRLWRDYSLSILLGTLFLTSCGRQIWVG